LFAITINFKSKRILSNLKSAFFIYLDEKEASGGNSGILFSNRALITSSMLLLKYLRHFLIKSVSKSGNKSNTDLTAKSIKKINKK
jgi:hypothetical protein